MSANGGAVDERIVRMEFQNDQFEKGVKESIRSLEDLKKALKVEESSESLKNVEQTLKDVQNQTRKTAEEATRQSKLLEQALSPLESKIRKIKQDIISWPMDQVVKGFDNIFVKPLKDGMDEYEEKMGKVQTLTNAVKWSQFGGDAEAAMDAVNSALDRLNTYADKTIYSFKDMTTAFTKFAQQASSLDEAEDAIVGLYNASAYYGLNKQQGSMVSYNMAQALGVGKMQLIDWKSFENAGMSGTDVKENIIAIAHALGKLDSAGHIIGATGKAAKNAVVDVDSFRETLQYDWFDKDVLLAWMELYSGTLPDNVVKQLEEFGVPVREIAEDAAKAASEIKSFGQLFDTLAEALGTGWGRTFEILFGDFKTLKERLSDVGGVLQDIVDKGSNQRNTFLERWLNADGFSNFLGKDRTKDGEDAFIFEETGVEHLTNSFHNLGVAIQNVADTFSWVQSAFTKGITEGLGLPGYELLADALGFTPESIENASQSLVDFTEKIKDLFAWHGFDKNSTYFDVRELGRGFGALLGIVTDSVSAAAKLGGKLLHAFSPIVPIILSIVSEIGKAVEFLGKGIRKFKIFDKIVDAFTPLLDKIHDFLASAPEKIKELLESIGSFFSNLYWEDILGKIGTVLVTIGAGLAVILSIGLKLVGSVLGKAVDLVKKLSSALMEFGGKALNWVNGQLQNPESPLSKVWEAIKAFVAPLEGEDEMPLTEYIRAKWHQLDPVFDVIREGYTNFLTQIFTLTGEEDPRAKAEEVTQNMIDIINDVKGKLKLVADSVGDFFGPVEHAAGTLKEDGTEYTFLDELSQRFEKLTPVVDMLRNTFEDFLASILTVFGVEDPEEKIAKMETDVGQVFGKIQAAFGRIGDAIGKFIGGEGEDGKGTGLFGTLQEKFKDLPTAIESLGKLFSDIIKAVFDVFVPSAAAEGNEAGGEEYTQQMELLEASVSDITNNLEGIAKPIEEHQEGINTALDSIVGFIKTVKTKITEGLNYLMSKDFDLNAFVDRMTEIAEGLAKVALTFGGANALNGIGSAGKGVKRLGNTLSDFFGADGPISTLSKGFTPGTIKDLITMSKTSRSISSAADNIKEASWGFLKVAGAVALIAGAAEILAKMNENDWTNFDTALVKLAEILGGTVIAQMLTSIKGLDGNGLKDMLKLGLGLKLAVWAIMDIVDLLKTTDEASLQNALELFGGLLLFFTGTEMITSLGDLNGNGLKGFVNLAIGLKFAVWALKDIVDLVKMNDEDSIEKALGVFSKILVDSALLKGILDGTSGFSGSSDGLKGFIGFAIALKLAIWAISDILNLLKYNDPTVVEEAFNKFGDLVVLFVASKFLSDLGSAITDSKGNFASFVTFAASLGACVWAIHDLVNLINEFGYGEVNKAMKNLGSIIGTFTTSIITMDIADAIGDKISGKQTAIGDIIDTLSAVGTFIAALAVSVWAIKDLATSNIDTERLTAITDGISELFIGVAAIFGSMAAVKGIAKAAPGSEYAAGLLAALNLLEFLGVLGAVGVAINEAEKAFPDQVQAFEDGLYKIGDLFHTLIEGIFGARDADKMADNVDGFKTVIGSFADIGADLNVDAVKAGADALASVAAAANIIPNEGGLLSWIVGDNSLGAFATHMEELGSGLASLNTQLSGDEIKLSTFQKVSQILKYFQSEEYPVANAGSFQAAITLKQTMKYIKEASDIANTIDMTGYDNAQNALGLMNTYTDVLVKLQKANLDMSSATMFKEAGNGRQLADGLMSSVSEVFADGGTAYNFGMWMGNIYNGFFETSDDQSGSAASAANQMVEVFTNYFNTTGIADFTTCGENLIGGFITGMENKTDDATESAKVFATKVMEEIASALDIHSPSKETEKEMMDSLDSLFDSMGVDISTDGGKEIASGFLTMITDGITNAGDTFISSGTGANVTDMIVGENGVLGFMAGYLTDFTQTGNKITTNTATGVEQRSGDTENAANEVAGTISTPLDALADSAYAWGANVTWGLGNGLLDPAAMSALRGAVNGVSKPIREIGSKQLEEQSPSKLTYGFGMYATMGLANGLADYAYEVEKSASVVSDAALDTMMGGLNNYSALLAMGIDPEPTIRPVLDLSEIEAGAGLMNSMFGDINVGRGQANKYATRVMARNSEQANMPGVNPEIYSAVVGLREDVRGLRGELSSLQVVMDGSALVGQIAYRMDKQLGANASRAGRAN